MPKKIFHIVGFSLIVLILGGVILGLSLKPKPHPLSTPTKKETPVEETPTITQLKEQPDISNWKTYRNEKYGFELRYQDKYEFLPISNASELSDCDFYSKSDTKKCTKVKFLFSGKENFGYIKSWDLYVFDDLNDVEIIGQTTEVDFNFQKRAWQIKLGERETEIVPIWNNTLDGQSIFKVEAGGSHSSIEYYLIPNNQKNFLVFLGVPVSLRLRCEFIKEEIKKSQCFTFLNALYKKYKQNAESAEGWIPQEFFSELKKDVINILTSTFKFIK